MLEATPRNLAAEKGTKRTSETPQGAWLGGARKSSLWLCYAGPLAGRQKSGFSDNRRRPNPTGEVRKGGRKGSDRTKERVHRFRVRFGRKRKANRLPCLSLGFSNDRQSTLGSGDVGLAIFIASVSGSESLTSNTSRIFHFSPPPDFRMVFDAAERNGRFGRIQCQRGKESSSRGKRKRCVFLCRRTVRVKVKGKVISASFFKN